MQQRAVGQIELPPKTSDRAYGEGIQQ